MSGSREREEEDEDKPSKLTKAVDKGIGVSIIIESIKSFVVLDCKELNKGDEFGGELIKFNKGLVTDKDCIIEL